jgi:hypothetical protein
MKTKLLLSLFVTICINTICISQSLKNKVGDQIQGDFNGDGKLEYAFRVLTTKGNGNPVEDGIPDEYEIQFSDKTIKSIKANCCWFKLINEGDLDKDGTDEFSIIQAPENGCIGTVTTYTIKTKKSYKLFPSFSIFWCAELSDLELQKLVVRENNTIYYYLADPNDTHLLNEAGDKIQFERLKKVKAKNVIF